MPHSYVSSLFHVIFSTKERRRLITDELASRLWPYLGGIARKNDFAALAVGGVADHTHLLLSLPATISVSKAVQLIKGGSSKWIHDTFPTTSWLRMAGRIRRLQYRDSANRCHDQVHP